MRPCFLEIERALTFVTEAQLFSGSIRDNLDPFGQHEDYEVWEAVRQCGLSGKTPGPSRMPSRAVSRAASSKNLPAEGAKADRQSRAPALHSLQVEALKSGLEANDEDEEDEGREERVVIRSLDEKVAVGGKNYSPFHDASKLSLYTYNCRRSGSKTAPRSRSRIAETPLFVLFDHG